MALAPGTRLGPYEVTAAIGAGGMGEVYRAHDTRLDRDVAIKVLPSEVAADEDRLRRFEREARSAAALNHPGILALYDIGTDGGVSFIVTELLDGLTLRQRLAAERLTISRVIDLAAQIADGLAAAHARGIVHRDLKPENLFVTDDGRAKILDFGLARPISADVDAETRPATAPHTVLGTAGYMAPEQVRGQPVDHRADVFAFGAVLYEMVTGRRAFPGETVQDMMSAILKEAPATMASTAERPLPPSLVRIVDRCLEKSPGARFQSTVDLAFALKSLSHADSTLAASLPPATAMRAAGRWARLAPWLVALAMTTVALFAWRPWRAPEVLAVPPVVRFEIQPPAGAEFGSLLIAPWPSISPDGQHLLYLAGKRGGEGGIWIRSLHTLDARLLLRRAGGQFWSPDSRAVAFTADGQLKRMDLDSGIVETVCDLPSESAHSFGTWGSQGIIILPRGKGLVSVPASGGVPVALSSPDSALGQTAHRHPSFLPDGRHYLFQVAPAREIWVASLDGSVRKRVARADSGAVYSPPGWLLFVRQNTLFAQRFDLSRLETTGDAQPLVYDVRSNEENGRAVFTVSSTGVVAYRTGDQALTQTLTWLDRDGTTLGITKDEPAKYSGFALLPGEQSIVASIPDASNGGGDLWRIDLARGSRTRLTFDPRHDDNVVLSPDGQSTAWRSNRVELAQIFRKASTGVGSDEPWITMELSLTPSQWSRNYFVFDSRDREGNRDLWFMPTTGPAQPRPFLQTPYSENGGQLSPDEKWMVYESNETGSTEVFIRPFPPTDSGGKWAISDGEGGFAPRWRRDGRELLYFKSGSREVMSVTITPGPTPGFGTPRPLFHVPVLYRTSMAMTPDATRFLYAAPEVGASTPLAVIVNWTSLLAGK